MGYIIKVGDLMRHLQRIVPFLMLVAAVGSSVACLAGSEVGSVAATEIAPVLTPTATGVRPSPEISLPTASETVIPERPASPLPVIPSQTAEVVANPPAAPLVIHFIDVGQGDAILVVSPEGLIALIDGGGGDSEVVAYLQRQGVRRIDLMVATHPHEDHIGGLTRVLEALPVARVVTNGQAHTTAVYEHFLDAILNSGAEYSEVRRGDTVALGGMTFSVLNPGAFPGDELNVNSLVLRLVYHQTALLFMGDAALEAEGNLLAAGLTLKATILKVGHHGGCVASSPAFLQAVQPEVGIYSAGIENPYGHPCIETVNTLTQRGVLVLGTDVNGSIIVTVTADGYRINTEDGQEFRR